MPNELEHTAFPHGQEVKEAIESLAGVIVLVSVYVLLVDVRHDFSLTKFHLTTMDRQSRQQQGNGKGSSFFSLNASCVVITYLKRSTVESRPLNSLNFLELKINARCPEIILPRPSRLAWYL